jgi:hypothetical protein
VHQRAREPHLDHGVQARGCQGAEARCRGPGAVAAGVCG